MKGFPRRFRECCVLYQTNGFTCQEGFLTVLCAPCSVLPEQGMPAHSPLQLPRPFQIDSTSSLLPWPFVKERDKHKVLACLCAWHTLDTQEILIQLSWMEH